MVGLLDKFKNDKETKLREVEQQLRDSQAQISQLTIEKASTVYMHLVSCTGSL